jgi:hypothetical protein
MKTVKCIVCQVLTCKHYELLLYVQHENSYRRTKKRVVVCDTCRHDITPVLIIPSEQI